MNYAYRIRAGRAQPELFFHGEVLNVFNQFQLCGCGATAFSNGGITDLTTIGQAVRTPRNAPTLYQPFNPFTTHACQGRQLGFRHDSGSAFGTRAEPSRLHDAPPLPLLGRRPLLSRPT